MRETTIDVKISDAELQKLHEVIDSRFSAAADVVASLCETLFKNYVLLIPKPGEKGDLYSTLAPEDLAELLEGAVIDIRAGKLAPDPTEPAPAPAEAAASPEAFAP